MQPRNFFASTVGLPGLFAQGESRVHKDDSFRDETYSRISDGSDAINRGYAECEWFTDIKLQVAGAFAYMSESNTSRAGRRRGCACFVRACTPSPTNAKHSSGRTPSARALRTLSASLPAHAIIHQQHLDERAAAAAAGRWRYGLRTRIPTVDTYLALSRVDRQIIFFAPVDDAISVPCWL